MSANFNKVFLMGNLTRDVELKYTPNNQPVAAFGIAMNRRYRTREGEDREDTTFVDCEAWGRTAEVMNQYLAKGRPVFVEGRLKLDQWQDKDGNNRSKLRVVVENFQFIDSRPSGGGQAPAKGDAKQPAYAGNKDSAPAEHQALKEDDIPF